MKRNMVISLIGRPNVGKSSLFNRLMKKQNKALTHDLPGVTRDRHYGIAKFSHGDDTHEAILVDTGGFYPTQVEENSDNMNHFFNIMRDHAHLAIDESDMILLVVDCREGLNPFDESIVKAIRSKKKPFWLIVNKYDSDNQQGDEIDFYSLGVDYEEMFLVSASHGRGVELLREALFNKLHDFSFKNNERPDLQKGVTPREEVVARVAIIGAPNAGKSTLLNQFVGAERALVSDIAGTTVDPIEGYFDLYFGEDVKKIKTNSELSQHDSMLVQNYEDFRKNNSDFYNQMADSYYDEEETSYEEIVEDLEYFEDEEEINQIEASEEDRIYEQVFSEEDTESNEVSEEAPSTTEMKEDINYWKSIHIVDTAGIRKQRSIDGFIEEQSVYRSLRCITESDIVIFMVDVTKGIAHQDKRLLDIAIEKGKSVIVCLNKMDLIQDRFETEKDKREWLLDLRAKVQWLNYCDILPISAKSKNGLNKVKRALKKTIIIRRSPIPTGELNRFVFETMERNPVMVRKSGGRRLKVKYASMVKMDPPTFLLFSNKSRGIPENYKRYLKNSLRNHFSLDNTPVHLIFRTGSDLKKRVKKAVRTD